ncbi:hypothetical protein V8E51_019733 [Hyaloscypha variabilis]
MVHALLGSFGAWKPGRHESSWALRFRPQGSPIIVKNFRRGLSSHRSLDLIFLIASTNASCPKFPITRIFLQPIPTMALLLVSLLPVSVRIALSMQSPIALSSISVNTINVVSSVHATMTTPTATTSNPVILPITAPTNLIALGGLVVAAVGAISGGIAFFHSVKSKAKTSDSIEEEERSERRKITTELTDQTVPDQLLATDSSPSEGERPSTDVARRQPQHLDTNEHLVNDVEPPGWAGFPNQQNSISEMLARAGKAERAARQTPTVLTNIRNWTPFGLPEISPLRN